MEKVKAGLRGASAEAKAIKAGVIYAAMHGNPDFPDPVPSMAELLAGKEELDAANLAALDRGRAACLRKQNAVTAMDSLLSRLAAYVNSVCQGNAVKLAGSGFEFARQARALDHLPAPEVMSFKRPPHPGHLQLEWSRVHGARLYELEIAHDDAATQWQRVALTSRPQFTLTDLEPGALHRFRVCAVGTRAQSPYSSVLTAKVAA